MKCAIDQTCLNYPHCPCGTLPYTPMALDQGDIDIALQEAQVLEDDGRPTAADCIRACAKAAQATLRAPTERERIEMCGNNPADLR